MPKKTVYIETSFISYFTTPLSRDLANAIIQRRIAKIARTFGYEIPYICTPLEMIGE